MSLSDAQRPKSDDASSSLEYSIPPRLYVSSSTDGSCHAQDDVSPARDVSLPSQEGVKPPQNDESQPAEDAAPDAVSSSRGDSSKPLRDVSPSAASALTPQPDDAHACADVANKSDDNACVTADDSTLSIDAAGLETTGAGACAADGGASADDEHSMSDDDGWPEEDDWSDDVVVDAYTCVDFSDMRQSALERILNQKKRVSLVVLSDKNPSTILSLRGGFVQSVVVSLANLR